MKSCLSMLQNSPVLIDACIFMKGIDRRTSDPNYSFERMQKIVLEPFFDFFQNILIHEKVYAELDEDSKSLVDKYRGRNVTIVDEGGLYGLDPQYTDL